MNSLPEVLSELYKKEYETTDITIDELQDKYSLHNFIIPEDWNKRAHTAEIVKPSGTIVTPVNTNNGLQSTENSIHGITSIQSKVEEFKELAIDHALKFMKNDAQFAEVKEFKDMVSIVGTIEASYKDTKPENTINIAIQNIVKGFTDDC